MKIKGSLYLCSQYLRDAPVLAGAYPSGALEIRMEIRLGGEAAPGGDAVYRHIGLYQQLLCPLHAQGAEIFMRAAPDSGLEQPQHVQRRIARKLAEPVERHPFAGVVLHIFHAAVHRAAAPALRAEERIEPQQKLEQERVLRRAAAGALGGKLLDYLPEQRRLYAAAGKVPGDGADKLVLIPQLLGAKLEKYRAAAKGRAAAEPVAGEGKAQVPGMYPLRLTVI